MGIIFCILLIILIIIHIYFLTQFPYPSINKDFDTIIVLGYHCHDDGSLDEIAQRRIQCAYQHHQNKPNVNIIISGGCVTNEHNEAQVMGQYAIDLGIPKDVIIYEPKARNTYENLLYSSQFIDYSHKVLVITSRFHIRRSAYFVRKFYPNFTMSYHESEQFHLKDAILEYFRMWNSLWIEFKIYLNKKKA